MTTQTVTVSIENLSPENGAFLTPLWFGFHDGTFDTYDRGRPVSPGLASLVEDGATDLISQKFDLAGFGTVQGIILGPEGKGFQVAHIRAFLDNLVAAPVPAPTAFVVRRFQVNRAGIELLNNQDSLRLLGRIETPAPTPGVLTEAQDNRIRISRGGAIASETTAIQVNGVDTTINNLGLIDGEFNGINLANGDVASATILNRGTITSASRAVNIGGVGGRLVNFGQILTTGSPRNGTIYADESAQNVAINNRGLIDVGAGNDGDAISLEVGAQVDGQVVNRGLIQGRGVPLGNNQAAAVRLYWGATAGPVATFNGSIKNQGQLAAENGPAVIVGEQVALNGNVLNRGLIASRNPANGVGVRIAGEVTGEVINRGKVNGGRDGIDIANNGTAIATLVNHGLITSASRAINLGGAHNRVVNEGRITTSADPRNGTIYGNDTALAIDIDNRGLIDVGAGNNGDAISLEVGPLVTGSLLNTGHIQGRGEVLGNNQAAAIRLFQPAGADASVFQGDIVNAGLLAAEQGAAVVVAAGVQFDGALINSGAIEGGLTEAASNGRLAIDGRGAVGGLTVVNTGTIQGDVWLSDGDDQFIGTGGIVNGVVQGNSGDDILIGGDGDAMLYGGDGDDILEGGLGNNLLTGGAGADTFRFGSDLLASGGGYITTITDFEAIDSFDFSGFLGAGGEFSLAVLGDRLIANLSTGDTVTVLGDVDAAAAQLVPLATDVALA